MARKAPKAGQDADKPTARPSRGLNTKIGTKIGTKKIGTKIGLKGTSTKIKTKIGTKKSLGKSRIGKRSLNTKIGSVGIKNSNEDEGQDQRFKQKYNVQFDVNQEFECEAFDPSKNRELFIDSSEGDKVER